MRYATAFGAVTLPVYGRSEQVHEVRVRDATMAGFRTDGVLDAWGEGRAPLQSGIYSVPFWINASSESAFETAKAAIAAKVGQRDKLYFNTLAASSLDFALARMLSLKARYVAGVSGKAAAFVAEFRLLNPALYADLTTDLDSYFTSSSQVQVMDANFGESADWGADPYFASYTNPSSFSISGWPGQIKTDRVIIRIESDGSSGVVNPVVINSTLGLKFAWTGTLNANGVLQANASIGPNQVRTSADSGGTFVTDPSANRDYANVTLYDTQVPMMEISPGNSSWTVSGISNGRLMFLAWPASLL